MCGVSRMCFTQGNSQNEDLEKKLKPLSVQGIHYTDLDIPIRPNSFAA